MSGRRSKASVLASRRFWPKSRRSFEAIRRRIPARDGTPKRQSNFWTGSLSSKAIGGIGAVRVGKRRHDRDPSGQEGHA
jgi:hypothetical protein